VSVRDNSGNVPSELSKDENVERNRNKFLVTRESVFTLHDQWAKDRDYDSSLRLMFGVGMHRERCNEFEHAIAVLEDEVLKQGLLTSIKGSKEMCDQITRELHGVTFVRRSTNSLQRNY
jgi:flagellar basal body L-ring protein FlgH